MIRFSAVFRSGIFAENPGKPPDFVSVHASCTGWALNGFLRFLAEGAILGGMNRSVLKSMKAADWTCSVDFFATSVLGGTHRRVKRETPRDTVVAVPHPVPQGFAVFFNYQVATVDGLR